MKHEVISLLVLAPNLINHTLGLCLPLLVMILGTRGMVVNYNTLHVHNNYNYLILCVVQRTNEVNGSQLIKKAS